MAPQGLKGALRALADVFLPRYCILCGMHLCGAGAIDMCPSCIEKAARKEGRYCPRCAAAMPQYGDACPNCRNMSLAMAGSTAFGAYSGRLRDTILAMKFHRRRSFARTFGHLVAKAASGAWPDVKFDAVVAVPLHPGRRKERGFDQARSIARHTARALGVPERSREVRRVRATASQVGLTKTGRTDNVAGAFAARLVSPLVTVLVVDDIMTTGATASAVARALKAAGVKKAYAAVVARADISGDGGLAAVGSADEGSQYENEA